MKEYWLVTVDNGGTEYYRNRTIAIDINPVDWLISTLRRTTVNILYTQQITEEQYTELEKELLKKR